MFATLSKTCLNIRTLFNWAAMWSGDSICVFLYFLIPFASFPMIFAGVFWIVLSHSNKYFSCLPFKKLLIFLAHRILSFSIKSYNSLPVSFTFVKLWLSNLFKMFEDTCGNLKKIIAKSEIFFFLFIGYELLSFSALRFELTTFMFDV